MTSHIIVFYSNSLHLSHIFSLYKLSLSLLIAALILLIVFLAYTLALFFVVKGKNLHHTCMYIYAFGSLERRKGKSYKSANVTRRPSFCCCSMSFQKAEDMRALPLLKSSLFQSVCSSDVLRVIEIFEGRGSVSRAG